MDIKFVIFDLDGVLVEAKEIHYDALNEALGDKYSISMDEHLSVYDGLKTSQKLEILTNQKGLPVELYDDIWSSKQKITISKLKKIPQSEQLIECFNSLLNDGYKIYDILYKELDCKNPLKNETIIFNFCINIFD